MFEILKNKALVVSGLGQVGKHLLQQFINGGYSLSNIVLIDENKINLRKEATVFCDVTPLTRLIVVQNVTDLRIFEFFKPYVAGERIKILSRSKPGLYDYTVEYISPSKIQFIFLTYLPADLLPICPSTSRRFHVFNLYEGKNVNSKFNGKPN